MSGPVDALPPPPVDPRTDLPAFGALPAVSRVDGCAVRVIAPNPSPMTLDGTNTYVLFGEDGRDALVLDPGPPDAAHRVRVDEVLAAHDLTVAHVVATHHHHDHTEAAAAWAADWGVRVVAATADVAGAEGVLVGDGDVLRVDGLAVDVVATPGHTRDSLSLRLPTGAVCTGDHVLGRGTTVVAHPDGTLAGYLDSLRRVLDLGPAALLTGHGPAVTEDPAAVLRFHQDHRAYRLAQVEAVLRDGPCTARRIVEVLYAAYPQAVWGAAEASTLAALELLAARGVVVVAGDTARLVDG